MKSKMMFFAIVVMASLFVSCSDDDDPKVKGDPDVAHEGDKWTITSVEYVLIDQSTSGQTMKSGTKANPGSFYFRPEGGLGSFEMNVEGYNKEDRFGYTTDQTSISIVSVEQDAGTSPSQNILVLSGDQTDTEMTLSGTITKQSTTGQFILTVDMTLTKD